MQLSTVNKGFSWIIGAQALKTPLWTHKDWKTRKKRQTTKTLRLMKVDRSFRHNIFKTTSFTICHYNMFKTNASSIKIFTGPSISITQILTNLDKLEHQIFFWKSCKNLLFWVFKYAIPKQTKKIYRRFMAFRWLLWTMKEKFNAHSKKQIIIDLKTTKKTFRLKVRPSQQVQHPKSVRPRKNTKATQHSSAHLPPLQL